MTRQSLDSMAAHRAESIFDVSRFRPNILLDAPDTGSRFPEQTWTGKRVQLGEVILDVVGECPRCAMTTHGFAELPKDPGIMRALVQANGGNLGVYAKVVQPGRVSSGDSLELLDS
jgi:uncharacterized protein YcbX